jgi:thioesterase domain-containing protein
MLRGKHPIHAFVSAGLLPDSEPDQTIEQMARRYVERLLARQPQGPYLLGGWSQGASIALEMAHILRSSGREVAHLFSIDNMFMTTDTSPLTAEKVDFDFLLLNLLFQQVTAQEALRQFKALSEEGKIDHLVDAAGELKLYSPSLDKAAVRRMLRVFYFNCFAGWQYDKTRIEDHLSELPVTYFFATEDAPFERERKGFTMLRDEFKEKRRRESPVFEIAGSTHFNLLSMPHVKALATSMASALETVQSLARSAA